MKRRLKVRVPASTSNLGAGFDVFGLALDLHNELVAERDPSLPGIKIEVSGEGEGRLPEDERNLVWQTMRLVLKRFRQPQSGWRLRMRNRIPLARGLGSSSAARLAGILAGNAFSGGRMAAQEIVNLAARLEGHPDNVVPSCVGGFCVSAWAGADVRFARLAPPRGLAAVVCVPDFELSTEKARAVLPASVARRDAVFNVSRAALFLAALFSGKYEFLRLGMEDRLHQDYRKRLIPGFDRARTGALRAGAFGAALSGAGPCVFAFAPRPDAEAVGGAMARGFAAARVRARSLTLRLNAKGAEARWL